MIIVEQPQPRPPPFATLDMISSRIRLLWLKNDDRPGVVYLLLYLPFGTNGVARIICFKALGRSGPLWLQPCACRRKTEWVS